MDTAPYKYVVSRTFVKKWNKFNPKTKKTIADRIDMFLKNSHNPQLKTHKLTGKLKGYWAFSVEYNLRIMFEFANTSTVNFIDIGTHQIYK